MQHIPSDEGDWCKRCFHRLPADGPCPDDAPIEAEPNPCGQAEPNPCGQCGMREAAPGHTACSSCA